MSIHRTQSNLHTVAYLGFSAESQAPKKENKKLKTLHAHKKIPIIMLKVYRLQSCGFLLMALVCIIFYIKNILVFRVKSENIFPRKNRYR